MARHASELVEFIGHCEAQCHSHTWVSDSKRRRDRESRAICDRPCHGWGKIVRRLPETEMLVRSQAAIHFHSGLKVLSTEVAAVRPCGQRQGPADPDSVAELKGRVPDVLFGYEILRERPTLEVIEGLPGYEDDIIQSSTFLGKR